MDKAKVFKIVGGTLLGGGAAYLLYNQFVVQPMKTSEIDQITELITGKNAAAAAAAAQANAFSPLFWQTLNNNGTATMSPDQVTQSQTDASSLNDNLGTFTFEDAKVIGIFKTFPTKAYVSLVTYSFQQQFQLDLLTDLNHMSDANKATVLAYVDALPDS